MPSFHSYGIHTFLELQDTSSSSISKLSRISESTSKITWSPMQGMTHPILRTDIISPAKSGSPLPFCIVVEFDADADRDSPNHLKGDVRIEVKIDGMVSGWRVLPQAKIWPKGARIEFSGLRVARTEEMAFMFNPRPRNLGKSKDSLSASTSISSIEVMDTTETSTIWNSEDPTLIPSAPSDLPQNTSHIEILVTVGQKHNTLEKYLIFSPVLQEAFYNPPKSLSSKWLGHSINVNIQGTKRKLESQQSSRNQETDTAVSVRSPYKPAPTGSVEQPREIGEQNIHITGRADKEIRGWKPIGLSSVSQKTTQMREAEFTARLHVARFWFIIYPEPIHLDRPNAHISSIPSATSDGQCVSKSAEILADTKKIAHERTLDKSNKFDIFKVEDNDAVTGRKRRITKNMQTSGINELLPVAPRPQEDGRTRRHEVVGSSTPALQGVVYDVQYQKGSKPTPKTHGSVGDSFRSGSPQEETRATPKTLIPPTGLVSPSSELIGLNNAVESENRKLVLGRTKKVGTIKKKTG